MELEVHLRDEAEVVQLDSREDHVASLVQQLESRGFEVAGLRVEYWSELMHTFVTCGVDPLPVSVVVPEFELKGRLVLRFVQPDWTDASHLPSTYLQEAAAYRRYPEIEPDQSFPVKKKERIIGHVLERVTKWREIVKESKRRRDADASYPEERQTLEEAAKAVGIAKKSLDDYLLMIRFGRKFGFNFEAHCDERVGVLRNYVKTHKEIVRLLQASTQEFEADQSTASRLPGQVARLIRTVYSRCNCCRPPGCDYSSLLKYEE